MNGSSLASFLYKFTFCQPIIASFQADLFGLCVCLCVYVCVSVSVSVYVSVSVSVSVSVYVYV